MKIPSIFKRKDTKWPSCNNPKTHSFRDDIFKTVNSVFFDSTNSAAADGVETPQSWFTNSSSVETASFSTESNEFDGESLEMVVRGVTAATDRLFFEPGGDTNSILEEAKPFKESVVIALESDNPYVDFRKSMEEMVESHGLKDWECLEELLRWYLKVNGKKNHGFIVQAFIDLLVQININAAEAEEEIDTSCSNATFSSAVSCFASSFSFSSVSPNSLFSFQQGIHEIQEQDTKV